ncbi:tetratricopeptide repeat protein [Clostridium botulinum]|uniref:tetratricopeptide repeat protein n=1 Tax=Clostridium botulinum TaxID=1491 RepID=UPI000772D844|nr:tetratricopeptide repeat protein [Clostridium botulinum]
MDIWLMLGIKETKDKTLIKEAYMEKLNVYNPEDNAEGFQKLRAAYEKALKIADEDNKDKDDSPIGVWIDNVERLYNKFSLRINEVNWKEILEDELCFQLDSAEEVSDRLLTFLLDKYYIPSSIFKLFDETFSWMEKEEELKEKYHENFIDFIMYKIKSNDDIRYELFNPIDDKNYDEFIFLFYELKSVLRDDKLDEAKNLLDRVEDLSIEHPDMTILKIKYYIYTKEFEKARSLGDELIEKYEDQYSYFILAQIEFHLGDEHIEKAMTYYEKVLEEDKEHIGAIKGLADCCFELGKYEDAKKDYMKVLDIYPYNEYITNCVRNTNIKLIEKYKEELDNAKDNEIKFKLAWLQFQVYAYEDTRETAESIEPEEDEKCQYYDLLGRTYSELKRYEESLGFFRKWHEINDNEDNTAYIYVQIGKQLENLNKLDEALEWYNKSLELRDNYGEANFRKCRILNKLNRYEESVDTCNIGLKLNNSNAHVYLCKGEALYKLGDFREALDSLDNCIRIYPYFIDSYKIQIEIYFKVGQYENVLSLVKETEYYNITNIEIQIYKVRALRKLEKYDEAFNIANKLLKDEDEKEDIYYELSLLSSHKEDYDKAIFYVNECIKINQENLSNYYLRMSIYRDLKRYDEALEDANTIINKDDTQDVAYERKAILYNEMELYDKCINCYKKAIQIDPNYDEYYNSLGQVYEKIEDFEEAFNCYKKAIKINPKQAYSYGNIGILYGIWHRDYEKKIEYIEKQMEFNNDYEYFYNTIGATYAYDLNDYENAIKYFTKTTEIDDQNDYAFVNLGYCYAALENYKKAIKCYLKGLEITGGHEYIYNQLGDIYENNLYDYNKAIENYRNVAKLNPKSKDVYLDLASCYRNLGLYTEALIYYEKQIEETGETAHLYNCIGVLYEIRFKNYEKAIEFYKKVIKLNPKHKEAYKNIGDCYGKAWDNHKEALKYYKKQEKYLEDSREISLDIADSYDQLGKKISARRYYKKALQYYLELIKDGKEDACTYKDVAHCYIKIGNDKKAYEFYEKAIKIAPISCDCDEKKCHSGYFGIGKIYLKNKDYHKALEYINKAIDIKDDEEYKEEKYKVLELIN